MSDANATERLPIHKAFYPDFAHAVALITGGTSGIGLEIARQFAIAGARVVLVGTDKARGRQAAEQLNKQTCDTSTRTAEQGMKSEIPHVLFLRADAASRSEMDQVVRRTAETYGRLDVVVCSAGVGRKATLLETTEDDLALLLRVNVQGAIVPVQAASKMLAESRGNVTLISSDAGVTGECDAGAYSVSKAAVNMATKMLALDLAHIGVRVNAVAPGDIVPGMRTMVRPGEISRKPQDYLSWRTPPLHRFGQAGDVASTVLFLSSDAAAFITGSIVLIDGGMRAGIF